MTAKRKAVPAKPPVRRADPAPRIAVDGAGCEWRRTRAGFQVRAVPMGPWIDRPWMTPAFLEALATLRVSSG